MSPISPIVLQRRHAELGRIRLGDQVPAGEGRTRPNKLDRFRFTSVSERYIRDLATLYGGEAKPWDNNGLASWEVYSEARSVPVIVIKGGLSQWMEFWSGGGCIHRCDGEINVLTGDPCDFDEQVQVGRKTVNPHAEAKPTTRLSLMLVELEAIGVWRCETHGWNAAAEIPAVAELAQFVGDLVPANLHLVERRSVKDGKTSRFVVPVLDLQIGTARLKEIVAAKSGTGELPAATQRTAIAAAPAPAGPDYLAELAKAVSVDDCTLIWRTAGQAGHLTDELKAAITAKAAGITAANFETPGSAPGPDTSGADPGLDEDALWHQIVAEAGRLDMDDPELRAELTRITGASAEDATVEQLATFLHALKTGEMVA